MNSMRHVVHRALPPHACRMSTPASCSIASTRRLPDSTSTDGNPSTDSVGRRAILTYGESAGFGGRGSRFANLDPRTSNLELTMADAALPDIHRPSQLWKKLPPERKLEAADAFWQDENASAEQR